MRGEKIVKDEGLFCFSPTLPHLWESTVKKLSDLGLLWGHLTKHLRLHIFFFFFVLENLWSQVNYSKSLIKNINNTGFDGKVNINKESRVWLIATCPSTPLDNYL